MARHRYLVAYDIADAKRLRRVCTIMEGYGQRLQYSVFLCDLSLSEVSSLERDVLDVMSLAEDSVVRIDLGPELSSATVRFIGRHRDLPGTDPLVV